MKTLNILVGTLVLSILFYSCDKNEFPPEILDQEFVASENSNSGTTIGTVVASDVDGPSLSYEIVDGNEDRVFAIDASSGKLSIDQTEKLDYESTMHYILQVVVSDNHPKDPLESSANMYIDITDANEFAPSIPSMENQEFIISEDSPIGTQVGVVEAMDEDSEQTLTYSIKAGNESGLFAIDSEKGIITVVNSSTLDYETTQQYLLNVAVTDDHQDNPRESTATMKVDVLDVNEFAPEIEDQILTINENPFNGQELGVIEATDGDIHQNLTFSILEQDKKNSFQIDSISGLLTVDDSSALDFEITPQITLEIQVEDNQSPSLKTKATITVNITDELEITDGLISYYPFNGNANDESGNQINGQLNGPSLTTDRNQNPESAYIFDGVDDYINLANSSPLHFGNKDFSISVWYEFPEFKIGPQDVISIYSSTGSNREFRLATNPIKDTMYFMIFDNGGSSGDMIVFPREDGWQHVTITKSSNTLRLYINGELHSEKPVTASVKTTGSRALIGAVDKSTTSPDSFFEGKIDDIYIHNRVLGEDEVKSLYHRK